MSMDDLLIRLKLILGNAVVHLGDFKHQIDNYLVQHAPELIGKLLAAGLILLGGRWVARRAANLLAQILEKANLDVTLSRFAVRIAHTLMVVVVALAALRKLDIDTTSLAAVLAAAGLAVGLALQGSLSNFASGVMLILFRPFKVGDFIEAGSTKGIVEEVHVFSTMLRTPDNVKIIVPNSSVTESEIRNYSTEAYRRIDLMIGCGYDDDLLDVKEFLRELMAADMRILVEPAPLVAVSELGESSVNFVVRPWVASAEYSNVRYDLLEKIKIGFDQRGFSIPFPQRDVHVHDSNSASKAMPTQPTPRFHDPNSETIEAEAGLRRRAA